MGATLYTLAIYGYGLAIRIAAIWSTKARSWLAGRRHGVRDLATWRATESRSVVWVHCASHGEYEQALPLIRSIRARQEETAIALTFFSPSGYQAVAMKAPVDWVGYIPRDTPTHTRLWLDTLLPDTVIFVKNEWWWHMLTEVQRRGVPLHVVSATIRPEHYFIRFDISYFTQCLRAISSIGVIDAASQQRLAQRVSPEQIYLSGDLRADQVIQIAQQPDSNQLAVWSSGNRYIIYGSVWQQDVGAIKRIAAAYPSYIHVLFPHNLEDGYVEKLRAMLNAQYLRNSNIARKGDILIVTELGILSTAYRYADLAYVGGGYGQGVHNVLEAVVYGIPCLVGPRHHKSAEALELIERGVVSNLDQLAEHELQQLTDPKRLQEVNALLSEYFDTARGATEVTYNHIFGPSQ